MERHAVPQNIMDIEFKLFGSLTVRQFGTLAVSFILAVLLYALNLPAIISYPLIFFIVVIGLAMAFLTVNSMPFGRWLGNFINSLFSQQRKVYRKSTQVPTALGKSVPTPKVAAKAPDTRQLRNAVIIQSLRDKSEGAEALAPQFNDLKISNAAKVDDILEENKLEGLDSYFQDAVKSNLGKYKLELADSGAIVNKVQASQERPLKDLSQPAAIQLPKTPGNMQPPTSAPDQAKTKQSGPSRFKIAPAALTEAAKPIAEPVTFASTDPIAPAVPSQAASQPVSASMPTETASASGPIAEEGGIALPQLNIMNRLRPNQVAGFVVDKSGKAVENAEVMIKDASAKLLRSVFADLKGKFVVPSALPAGDYIVEIKKTGYKFPEYKLKLEDQLVPVYKYTSE